MKYNDRALEDSNGLCATFYFNCLSAYAKPPKSEADFGKVQMCSMCKIKRPKQMFESFYLARPRGFEPLTYRFVAGHSIR